MFKKIESLSSSKEFLSEALCFFFREFNCGHSETVLNLNWSIERRREGDQLAWNWFQIIFSVAVWNVSLSVQCSGTHSLASVSSRGMLSPIALENLHFPMNRKKNWTQSKSSMFVCESHRIHWIILEQVHRKRSKSLVAVENHISIPPPLDLHHSHPVMRI